MKVILANVPVPSFGGFRWRMLICLGFVFVWGTVLGFGFVFWIFLEMDGSISVPSENSLGHILAHWSTYSYKSMINQNRFGKGLVNGMRSLMYKLSCCYIMRVLLRKDSD